MKKLLVFSLLSWALMACTKDDETATLAVTPDTPIEFSAAANEVFTLIVSTNQCNWDAVSDQAWCRVSAVGPRLTITALPNTLNISPTPATITVRAGSAAPIAIQVTQLGSGGATGDPILVVTPTAPIQFTAEARETFVLNIETNQGAWDAVSDQSWCRVIPSGSRLTVTAIPNMLATSPAPATITLSAGNAAPVTIQVSQLAMGGAADPILVVTPTDPIQFSAEATETFLLNVETNQGPWDAVSDQPWCRVIPGGNKIVINALPNARNFSPAPATITITSGKAAPIQITVTQLASQFVYMPDLAFNNLMISQFDTNGDGKLSLDEAAQVTVIQHYGVNMVNIFDITGIEACVNLVTLTLQGTEYFSNVDLTKNRKLETIIFQSKRLTNLNVTGLVNLTTLNIYEGILVELDVSTNTSLLDFGVPYSVLTLWVSPGQAIDGFYFNNPETVIKYR